MEPISEAVSDHMRRIRTKRTGLENRVRFQLRRNGLRFRGNVKELVGSPDFVLADFKIAIFANGCFWHGCPRCFRPPKHNRSWWLEKIAKNRRRDRRAARLLRADGFTVLHLWEHDSDSRISKRIVTAARNAR